MLDTNFNAVKQDISLLIQTEIGRINNDPALSHLMKNPQPSDE